MEVQGCSFRLATGDWLPAARFPPSFKQGEGKLNQPLFEVPEAQSVALSQYFDTHEYRGVAGSKIKYNRRTMKRFHPCEECAWWQHEHGGKGPSKRAVRYRRTGPGVCSRCPDLKPHPAHIDLCNEHARLWQARDERDLRRG